MMALLMTADSHDEQERSDHESLSLPLRTPVAAAAANSKANAVSPVVRGYIAFWHSAAAPHMPPCFARLLSVKDLIYRCPKIDMFEKF